MTPPDPGPRATERFIYWLGKAAQTARETAKIDRARIASEAPDIKSERTIERFEKGAHQPRHPESLAAVYAHECGVVNKQGEPDARILFAAALKLWRSPEGHRPLLDYERAVATNPDAGTELTDALSEAAKTAAPKRPRRDRRANESGNGREAGG